MLKIIRMYRRVGAVILTLVMICSLIVVPCNTKAAGKLKLNKTKINMTVGQKTTLKVKNISKGKRVVWKTNKKSIATVNNKGKITAKKKGTAIITAKVGNKKLKCKVTVKAKTNKKTEKTTESKTTENNKSYITEKIEKNTSDKSDEKKTDSGEKTSEQNKNSSNTVNDKKANSDDKNNNQQKSNENGQEDDDKTTEIKTDDEGETSDNNTSEENQSRDQDNKEDIVIELKNTEGKDKSTVEKLKSILELISNDDSTVSIDLNSDEYQWEDGKLTGIWWDNKNISGKISFSGLKNLQVISCANNLIDELDISKNIELNKLYCYSNKLVELDLKNNIKLDSLACSGNKITTLDLTNNKLLTYLSYDKESVNLIGYDTQDNSDDQNENDNTEEISDPSSEDNTEEISDPSSEDNTEETSEDSGEDTTEEESTESVPSITYQTHTQYAGWGDVVKDGEVGGSTGKDRRLEAIKINLNDKEGNSAIKYRAYIENSGWQGWKESGEVAGTENQELRMEAIQIQLQGEYADKYDIYYSAHIAQFGWLGWAKNGEEAGSRDLFLRMEAIKIVLVKKGESFDVVKRHVVLKPDATYKAYSAYVGWRNPVSEGKTAGAANSRLEAFMINMNNEDGTSAVEYRAHCSNTGWQAWKSSGETAGTTNKSRAVEAVEIKLSGQASKDFDIYYRVYVANIGWLGWASNGETAGTTGGGRQAEAIVIKLVYKGASVERGGAAYRELTQNSLDKTADDAIAWCKSLIGQSLDKDGAEGCQCVDLILAYYDYLGVPRTSGWGKDYTWNSLPDGWTRVQGGTPQKGDILVYTGGAGHVAIYESYSSTFHQNYDGPYVQNVTGISYKGFTNPYWGYIRPNWAN